MHNIVLFCHMAGEGNNGGPEQKAGVQRTTDGAEGGPAGETDEERQRRLDEEWDRAEEMAVQGINAARSRMDRRMQTRVAAHRRP